MLRSPLLLLFLALALARAYTPDCSVKPDTIFDLDASCGATAYDPDTAGGRWASIVDGSTIYLDNMAALALEDPLGTGLMTLHFEETIRSTPAGSIDISPSVHPQLTLEVLAFVKSLPASRGMFVNQDNFSYDRGIWYSDAFGSGTGLGAGNGAAYTSTLGAVEAGDWIHAMAVYNESSGEVEVYRNGYSQLVPRTTALSDGTNFLSIGSSFPEFSSHRIDAKIAYVRVYGRALSKPEAYALHKVAEAAVTPAPRPVYTPDCSTNKPDTIMDLDASCPASIDTNTNSGQWSSLVDAAGIYLTSMNELDYNSHANGLYSFTFDQKLRNTPAGSIDISPSVYPQLTMEAILQVRSKPFVDGMIATHDNWSYDRGIYYHHRFGALDWGAGRGSPYTGTLATATPGEWYHVVASWDAAASQMTVYVNNASQLVTPTVNSDGLNYLGIGSSPDSRNTADHYSDMNLALLRVYNRSLSTPEVSALWESGAAAIASVCPALADSSPASAAPVAAGSFAPPCTPRANTVADFDASCESSFDAATGRWNSLVGGLYMEDVVGTMPITRGSYAGGDQCSRGASTVRFANQATRTFSLAAGPENYEELTIEIMVRRNGASGSTNEIIVSNDNGSWDRLIALRHPSLGSDSPVGFGHTTSGAYTSTLGAVGDNTWVHLVGTWKNGESTVFYRDGTTTQTLTCNNDGGNSIIMIGSNPNADGSPQDQYANADVAWLRVYDKVLDPTEVAALWTEAQASMSLGDGSTVCDGDGDVFPQPVLNEGASGVEGTDLVLSFDADPACTSLGFEFTGAGSTGACDSPTLWTVDSSTCGLTHTLRADLATALASCGFAGPTASAAGGSDFFEAVVDATCVRDSDAVFGDEQNLTTVTSFRLRVELASEITVNGTAGVYGAVIDQSALTEQTFDSATNEFAWNLATSVQYPYYLEPVEVEVSGGHTFDTLPVVLSGGNCAGFGTDAAPAACRQNFALSANETDDCLVPAGTTVTVTFQILCRPQYAGSCDLPEGNTTTASFSVETDNFCPRVVEVASITPALTTYAGSAGGTVSTNFILETTLFGRVTADVEAGLQAKRTTLTGLDIVSSCTDCDDDTVQPFTDGLSAAATAYDFVWEDGGRVSTAAGEVQTDFSFTLNTNSLSFDSDATTGEAQITLTAYVSVEYDTPSAQGLQRSYRVQAVSGPGSVSSSASANFGVSSAPAGGTRGGSSSTAGSTVLGVSTGTAALAAVGLAAVAAVAVAAAVAARRRRTPIQLKQTSSSVELNDTAAIQA